MAPTWLTHRRALSRLGETRNVAAWTAAAVQVARAGVQLGLERREEALASDDGSVAVAIVRPRPLIAAVLPALDDGPTPETGRILTGEAATQRDYREQAGMLADAEPDLILVETTPRSSDGRAAMEEAVGTGVLTWVAATPVQAGLDDNGASLSRWFEASRHAGVAALLMPPPVERAAGVAAQAPAPWGGLLASDAVDASIPQTLRDWLEHGALVVGRLDGANPTRVAAMREIVDDYEGVVLAEQAASAARWQSVVTDAARMSPGGAALLLTDDPQENLPEGFEWLVTDARAMTQLSPAHFSLIVAAGSAAERVDRLVPLLRDGGILAVSLDGPLRSIEGLRILKIDADAQPTLSILRRED